MHDRTLTAIALVTSAIGLILLLVALATLDIEEEDAYAVPDGTLTVLEGDLVRVRTAQGRTVLTVATTVDAVLDGDAPPLDERACIRITGERSTYAGRAQLAVTRIDAC